MEALSKSLGKYQEPPDWRIGENSASRLVRWGGARRAGPVSSQRVTAALRASTRQGGVGPVLGLFGEGAWKAGHLVPSVHSMSISEQIPSLSFLLSVLPPSPKHKWKQMYEQVSCCPSSPPAGPRLVTPQAPSHTLWEEPCVYWGWSLG